MGLSTENLFMKPYPASQSNGDNEKSIFYYRLSRASSDGKCISNIKPEISNLSKDPAITVGKWGHIVTCILHNYLREQGVGLSDIGSSVLEAILQKYQTKEEVPTKVLLK
jgi:hypothetical protein